MTARWPACGFWSIFARRHGLRLGSIADLIQYRAATESLIERVGSRTVQTHAGEFQLIAYRDLPGDGTHLPWYEGDASRNSTFW